METKEAKVKVREEVIWDSLESIFKAKLEFVVADSILLSENLLNTFTYGWTDGGRIFSFNFKDRDFVRITNMLSETKEKFINELKKNKTFNEKNLRKAYTKEYEVVL